jgi:asparagine synthetase B (glutamine-hydrolysing)
MGSQDGGVWLTYNGEIYNYKELAKDLRARAGMPSAAQGIRKSSSTPTVNGVPTVFRA